MKEKIMKRNNNRQKNQTQIYCMRKSIQPPPFCGGGGGVKMRGSGDSNKKRDFSLQLFCIQLSARNNLKCATSTDILLKKKRRRRKRLKYAGKREGN